MITVAQIGQTYVKATQFLHPECVDVLSTGIRHDREFALVEADDRFVSSDKHGDFFPLRFNFDAAADQLTLALPDGRTVRGPAAGSGRRFAVNHAGLRDIDMAVVDGPWSEEISKFAGRPMHLARCVVTSGGVDVFPVTFVTTGSLRRLAREVGATVDAARFRAGFVFENSIEHEEDGWDGRLIKVGTATLKVRTAVPRCGITGFNPASGVRDQEVMRGLVKYREKTALPDGLLPGYATPGFATYAEVVVPGTVRVGDSVELMPVA
ncbi:MAG: MOSC domain-containing protein [Gammaproteobacteria bacterium]|nr:MOSC domain-containing protein [Gammaproteobacteria bacterium]